MNELEYAYSQHQDPAGGLGAAMILEVE